MGQDLHGLGTTRARSSHVPIRRCQGLVDSSRGPPPRSASVQLRGRGSGHVCVVFASWTRKGPEGALRPVLLRSCENFPARRPKSSYQRSGRYATQNQGSRPPVRTDPSPHPGIPGLYSNPARRCSGDRKLLGLRDRAGPGAPSPDVYNSGPHGSGPGQPGPAPHPASSHAKVVTKGGTTRLLLSTRLHRFCTVPRPLAGEHPKH